MSDIVDKQQNFINGLLLPSLKTLTLIRIITYMTQTTFQEGDFYKKDLNKILNKVNSLHLPGVLKHEACKLIKPIAKEMRIIKSFCPIKLHVHTTILVYQDGSRIMCPIEISVDSVCWTMNGIVDKIKTLENWVRNENGDSDLLVHAYAIACKFCAKDLIDEIWLKMSNSQRQSAELSVDPLTKYWYTLSTELSVDKYYSDMDLYYSQMFMDALSDKNVFATKYFWHKLAPQQQRRFLKRCKWEMLVDKFDFYGNTDDQFGISYDSCNRDILVFLLSQVNDKNELQKILMMDINNLLYALLYSWPWQRLFTPIIKEFWDYLSNENCCDIFCSMCEYIINHGCEPSFVSHGDIQELFCRCTNNVNYLSEDAYERSEIKNFILSGICPEEQINIIIRVTVQKPFPIHFFRSVFLNDLPFYGAMKKMSDSNVEETKLLRELILQEEYEMINSCVWRKDWQSLENFLNFCYNPNTIPIDSRVIIICKCIMYKTYLLIEKLFGWCGYLVPKDQSENKRIKSSHSNIDIPDYSFSNFILWAFNIETNNEIMPVIDFNNALLPCEGYIKSLYRLPYETKKTIVFTIFQLFTLDKTGSEFDFRDFAEHFFQGTEMQNFKNCLIVSDLGLKLFRIYVNFEDPPFWYVVFHLATWFGPLEDETIAKFKKIMNGVDAEYFGNHGIVEIKKIIIHLLECYDKNNDRIIWKKNSDISEQVQENFSKYVSQRSYL